MVFVFILIGLNLFVGLISVSSTFSLNEQEWVCQMLTAITMILVGFCVFVATTMGVNPYNHHGENELMLKLMIWMIY